MSDQCSSWELWTCPPNLSSVTLAYPSTTLSKCDDVIRPKGEFKSRPQISWDAAEQGKKYTLVMADPDAPGHGGDLSWLHWIVVNVPGGDLARGDTSKGVVVTDYAPPTPPKGTGVHRYYTYVFEDTSSSKAKTVDVRKHFDVKAFAQSRSLCDPVAMVMFQTQF